MTTLEELESITAVIDAQGFYINKEFVPVEVAVVSKGYSACWPLSTKYNLNRLSSKDRRNAVFVTNSIHGLPLSIPGCDFLCKYSSSDIKALLVRIFMKLSLDNPNVIFGCKNTLLLRLLDECSLKCVDLSNRKYFIPTLKQLDDESKSEPWFCSYHSQLPCDANTRRMFRCSFRKCQRIWQWLGYRIRNMKEALEEHDSEGWNEDINSDPLDRSAHNNVPDAKPIPKERRERFTWGVSPIGANDLFVQHSECSFQSLEEAKEDYACSECCASEATPKSLIYYVEIASL
jgi:hypothetical protein